MLHKITICCKISIEENFHFFFIWYLRGQYKGHWLFSKKKFVCILSPEAQLSWQRPKFRPTPLRCYDLLFSNAIGPVLTLLASMSPVTTAMIRFTHLLGSLGLERLCGVTTALGWIQGACTALQWFLVHMRCRSSPLTLILYILSLLKIIF